MIPLPKRADGQPAITLSGSRQITLVGANGSGKTRFMNDIIDRLSGKSFVLSVLTAFAPQRQPSQIEGSIDKLFEAAHRFKETSALMSPLEKVIEMVLRDEFKQLIEAKTQYLLGGGEFSLPQSKLDKLIRVWQKIFPNNQIFSKAGKLLFQTSSGSDFVPLERLSAGEKAALYYICAIQYAMPEAVVFIESPTLFLHPAIISEFWNEIEEMRPDCTFVYNTYDVEFVSSRTDNLCVWVKSYNAQENSWDYLLLNSNNLSDDLFLSMLPQTRYVY